MSWIIDLIIVALAALCVFMGYKRGLAKCVIKVLSFVVAIVVAAILYRPVGNWIMNNTEFDDNIRSSISQVVQDDVKEDGTVKEDSALPKSMIEHINDEIKSGVSQTKEKAVTTIADEVAEVSVYACSALGLFILTRVVLLIVTLIFSILTEIPILKQFDKLGGIIYGILQTLIIVFVVFAIISFISPVIEDSGLIATINKSVIGSVLYNNNILMQIVL